MSTIYSYTASATAGNLSYDCARGRHRTVRAQSAAASRRLVDASLLFGFVCKKKQKAHVPRSWRYLRCFSREESSQRAPPFFVFCWWWEYRPDLAEYPRHTTQTVGTGKGGGGRFAMRYASYRALLNSEMPEQRAWGALRLGIRRPRRQQGGSLRVTHTRLL